MNPSNAVLHTVREKEKAYTPDQEDPAVVQPYAAYSPAGQVQVTTDQNMSEISATRSESSQIVKNGDNR